MKHLSRNLTYRFVQKTSISIFFHKIVDRNVELLKHQTNMIALESTFLFEQIQELDIHRFVFLVSIVYFAYDGSFDFCTLGVSLYTSYHLDSDTTFRFSVLTCKHLTKCSQSTLLYNFVS